MLEGSMDILIDEESKKNVWDDSLKGAYKNGGINDPDFCVLKFTAKSGRYYYWFETESFEV